MHLLCESCSRNDCALDGTECVYWPIAGLQTDNLEGLYSEINVNGVCCRFVREGGDCPVLSECRYDHSAALRLSRGEMCTICNVRVENEGSYCPFCLEKTIKVVQQPQLPEDYCVIEGEEDEVRLPLPTLDWRVIRLLRRLWAYLSAFLSNRPQDHSLSFIA